jgi:hypothetical protein
MASLDFEVSTSGPRPVPGGAEYKPQFWVKTYGALRDRYEPLVLAWTSHNSTVLASDPGFLMTYGLVPRPGADGAVHWDDPTAPVRDVVCVSKPSVYDFPKSTHASVTISKRYLQDYLSLRQMALVQSFLEARWSASDAGLEARLGDKQSVDLDTASRRMRLFRIHRQAEFVMAETSGARIVAMPGPLPISNGTNQEVGLTWPGIEGPVDHDKAMRIGMEEVYVDDRILGDYEGRPEFRVHPESGAVKFGAQWSVSFCRRIGRDVIGLEIKKLYEGVPSAVTRRWHEFAITPPADTSYETNERTLNIAKRTKALTYGIVTLGENLALLAQVLNLPQLTADKFVVPVRKELEYSGWWSFGDAEVVARHVPTDMNRDAFLDRGLSLTKLLIETLNERSLRLLLRSAGVPDKETNDLGTLKLLDYVVRLCQVANSTGLRFAPGDSVVWQRLAKEGTKPERPIPLLFTLYDMRGLKAHRSEDTSKLEGCLARFGIANAETTPGYGLAMDRICDALLTELNLISATIASALREC